MFFEAAVHPELKFLLLFTPHTDVGGALSLMVGRIPPNASLTEACCESMETVTLILSLL